MNLWEAWHNFDQRYIVQPLTRHIVQSTGMDQWFGWAVAGWCIWWTMNYRKVLTGPLPGKAATGLAKWWLKRR